MVASAAFPAKDIGEKSSQEIPSNLEARKDSDRIRKISFAIKESRDLISAVALCIALLGIACSSIFIVTAEQTMSPNAITFNRLFIAAIAFGGWSSFQQISASHRTIPSDNTTSLIQETKESSPLFVKLYRLTLLLIAGTSFAASLVLSAWSLTQTSVANSTLLNNMMPIFTTLGAWLLLGQRFNVKFLVGMVVATVGAIAIGIEDLQVADSNLMGDGAALLAAVLVATALLSIERLRATVSTSTIMLGMSVIGSLLIIPTVLLQGDPILPTCWSSGCSVVALALISQVVGHGLLTYALKHYSSGLVSVSMLAIPVIAAVLAMFLFSETLSMLNSLAFLVVLIGIYLSISATNVALVSCSNNK